MICQLQAALIIVPIIAIIGSITWLTITVANGVLKDMISIVFRIPPENIRERSKSTLVISLIIYAIMGLFGYMTVMYNNCSYFSMIEGAIISILSIPIFNITILSINHFN